MAGIAIFDLDKTITRAPTWTRFLIFVNWRRPVFWLQLMRVLAQGMAYKLGLASRDSVKRVSLRTLAHLTPDEARAQAANFVSLEVQGQLRPGAVAAINWHLERGDRLVIATASVDLIADELARALGFHEVIATRIDWPDQLRQRPLDLSGLNCYGAEKLRRVEERAFGPVAFAYSDHISDLDLLLHAQHGFAVNPSTGLRKVAQSAGLTIVDFSTADITRLTDKAISPA